MKTEEFGKLVVETAEHYVGEIETHSNSGFRNKEFERLMKLYGFSKSAENTKMGMTKGMAWCALFTELVVRQACKKLRLAQLDKLYEKYHSAHCLTAWRNFDESIEFLTRQPGTNLIIDPQPGDIGLMRLTGTTSGHAVIVTSRKKRTLRGWAVETIEGNTSMNGSREGTSVMKKQRLLNATRGLVFVGFVRPKEAYIL